MAKQTKNAAKTNGNKSGTTAAPKATTKAKGKKAAKPLPNAYRVGSSYWAVVETLRELGQGRMHDAARVVATFGGVMGEGFAAFKAKPQRNENGKGWEEKVVQNCIVVNRPDYGAPLRKLGLEVRKDRDAEGYRFGLFKVSATAAAKPTTAPKKKAKGKTAPKVAKP